MKPKEQAMQSRNFSALYLISHAVKNERNILSHRHKPLFRGLCGIVVLLFLTIKVASPFLHTHGASESSNKVIIALHCDACEYEATQATPSDITITLPVCHFLYEVKVYETASPIVGAIHSSSESRGSPEIS